MTNSLITELLGEGWTLAELSAVISDLPDPVIDALHRHLDEDAGTRTITVPVTPIEQAMQRDPGYRPRPHLTYLSDRLAQAVADVEAGANRHLTVSMPPRVGKSRLTSTDFPTWLLRKHPDWKIGSISHSDTLAIGWTREVRRTFEEDPTLGVAIAPDAGAAGLWQTTKRGGMMARSAPGQSIIGHGFKVMIIDDIVRDFATAHSENRRQAIWDWWRLNALSRLEPPYLVIAIGCLTGDTPVLMADGTERPIRHVKPGDAVATYEGGRLVASVVNNWANQGPDHLYSVRMASGRVVRANARHPFLVVDENGAEVWQRTDSLRPGQNILTATGASGVASPAQRMDARSQSAVRDYAPRTTTRSDGPTGTIAGQRNSSAAHTSVTGMGLTRKTMTGCWSHKAEFVRSASGLLIPKTHAGGESCSLITATTQSRSEDYSATIATSSSVTVQPSNVSWPLSSTYDLTLDRIESITPEGYEDVYDIEIDRTHNFVANGLVTHNTRWHEDDFIGRLLSHDHEGDPALWEEITFPAIAKADDTLGREPGEPLLSPLVDETPSQALARWQSIRSDVGEYGWAGMYQQEPSPARGSIFNTDSWRYWTTDPALLDDDSDRVILLPHDVHATARLIDSWDATFTNENEGDWVVGQRWAVIGPRRFLLRQVRGRWTFTETIAQMTAPDWQDPRVGTILVEKAANGYAILDTLKTKLSGLRAIKPRESKEVRARAVTPDVERGEVILPHPAQAGHEWVHDLLSELREFPHAAHDDQVDSLTQLLNYTRRATGSIQSPLGTRTNADTNPPVGTSATTGTGSSRPNPLAPASINPLTRTRLPGNRTGAINTVRRLP